MTEPASIWTTMSSGQVTDDNATMLIESLGISRFITDETERVHLHNNVKTCAETGNCDGMYEILAKIVSEKIAKPESLREGSTTNPKFPQQIIAIYLLLQRLLPATSPLKLSGINETSVPGTLPEMLVWVDSWWEGKVVKPWKGNNDVYDPTTWKTSLEGTVAPVATSVAAPVAPAPPTAPEVAPAPPTAPEVASVAPEPVAAPVAAPIAAPIATPIATPVAPEPVAAPVAPEPVAAPVVASVAPAPVAPAPVAPAPVAPEPSPVTTRSSRLEQSATQAKTQFAKYGNEAINTGLATHVQDAVSYVNPLRTNAAQTVPGKLAQGVVSGLSAYKSPKRVIRGGRKSQKRSKQREFVPFSKQPRRTNI